MDIAEIAFLADQYKPGFPVSDAAVQLDGGQAALFYFQSVENIKITPLIALLRGVAFVVLGLCIFPWVWKETGVWLTITFGKCR